jgi:aryl-alcohol dehydrogenase-like predicted oxidoreductase
MRYLKLGNTGLDVSPIALGCMTYGEPERGHPTWSLAEDESRPLIKQAIEAGINFFDTANMYSAGASEEVLGRALKESPTTRCCAAFRPDSASGPPAPDPPRRWSHLPGGVPTAHHPQ